MRERLAKMIEPAQAKKVTMSTFHALCVRILRQDIERARLQAQLFHLRRRRPDGADQEDHHAHRGEGRKARSERGEEPDLQGEEQRLARASPDDEKTLVGAVFARYQAELKTLNAVDFDDLLLLTVKLLAEHAEVRDRWRRALPLPDGR